MGDRYVLSSLLFFSVFAIQLTQTVVNQGQTSNYITTLKPLTNQSLPFVNALYAGKLKIETMSRNRNRTIAVVRKYENQNTSKQSSSKDELKHCCRQSFYDQIIDIYHKTKARKGEKYTIDVLHSPFALDPKLLNKNSYSEIMKGKDIIASRFHDEDISYLSNLTSKSGSKVTSDKDYKSYYQSNHLFVNVQFLPFSECLNLDKKCLDPKIIAQATKRALRRNPPPVGVTIIIRPPPEDLECNERQAIEYFLSQLTLSSAQIIIGAIEPSLCRIASYLAEKYQKLLILWTCLEIPDVKKGSIQKNSNKNMTTVKEKEKYVHGYTALISPLADQVARSVRTVLQELGWKRVSILTIESSYWYGVTRKLDKELRSFRHFVSAIQVLPIEFSQNDINKMIQKIPPFVKAVLLVLPSSSSVVAQVMKVAGSKGLIRHAAIILVDPLSEPEAKYMSYGDLNSLSDPIRMKPSINLNETYKNWVNNISNFYDDHEINFDNLSSLPNHKEASYKLPHLLETLPNEVKRSLLLLAPQSVGNIEFPSGNTSRESIHFDFYEDFNRTQDDDENRGTIYRLAYDSVSLASHILRRNIGASRNKEIRKRRALAKKRHTLLPSIKKFGQRSEGSYALEVEQNKVVGIPGYLFDNPYDHNIINSILKTVTYTKNKKELKKRRKRWKKNESVNEISKEISKKSEIREKIFFEIRRIKDYGDLKAENRLANILSSNAPPNPPSNSSGIIGRTKKDVKERVLHKLSYPTSFKALQGNGFIYASGRRKFDFLLFDWKPSLNGIIPIYRILEKSDTDFRFNETAISVIEVLSGIDWAFDSVIQRDPPCELDEELCIPTSPPAQRLRVSHIIIIVVGCCVVLGFSFFALYFLRKWLRQKKMSKGPYKILLHSEDITLSTRSEAPFRKIGGVPPVITEKLDMIKGGHLMAPTPKDISTDKLHPSLARRSLREADEIRAKYKGDFVHMRYFYSHGHFEVKNKTMTLLKQMHDIRHENINSFLGLLCNSNRPGFVFDYSSRGSLEDIIKQKDIKLDWSFRVSLLTDLVRGVRHLHSSILKCHGHLTSRNCVIDARWVLKITDYCLGRVYEAQNIPQPMRSNRDLLWRAPEVLRDESLLSRGTQTSDVFSFAIIMQEVILRGEPYCMIQLSLPEIIARLKKPPPMIRPSVSKGAAPPDVINVMKQCWAELPEMRPDFNQIYDQFKKLNQGRRLNIVDTMFQMLEKYSSDLEELIRERTEQLDIEKKKTEQLLNRMLPNSVADQLKLGRPVSPEEFEDVTIYFSDIVGFTTISSYSTPFEVVELLNDLYTAFDATINHYNVYKVETIGDAYMVVGGVPKRTDDHATEIATMALDLLHLSGKFRIKHICNIPLMLRIGLHSGSCCAGVVGVTMPRYCLFGDTVNTASRMESTGSAWRIHISETTNSRLRDAGGFNIELRGKTLIKGKGNMLTYWLLGKDDFNKELPVPPEIGQSHGLDDELVRQGRQHYASRRESCADVMVSSVKAFQKQKGLRPPSSGKLPYVANQFSLTPIQDRNRKFKKSPILVRIENVDSGSCYEEDGCIRVSPVSQGHHTNGLGQSDMNLSARQNIYEYKSDANICDNKDVIIHIEDTDKSSPIKLKKLEINKSNVNGNNSNNPQVLSLGVSPDVTSNSHANRSQENNSVTHKPEYISRLLEESKTNNCSNDASTKVMTESAYKDSVKIKFSDDINFEQDEIHQVNGDDKSLTKKSDLKSKMSLIYSGLSKNQHQGKSKIPHSNRDSFSQSKIRQRNEPTKNNVQFEKLTLLKNESNSYPFYHIRNIQNCFNISYDAEIFKFGKQKKELDCKCSLTKKLKGKDITLPGELEEKSKESSKRVFIPEEAITLKMSKQSLQKGLPNPEDKLKHSSPSTCVKTHKGSLSLHKNSSNLEKLKKKRSSSKHKLKWQGVSKIQNLEIPTPTESTLL